MESIKTLQELNYTYLFFSFVTILLAWKAFASLWESTIGKLIKKLGIETKTMREKRENHELLIQTSKSVNTLSQNLNLLTQKHEQDIKEIHDNNLKYREQSKEIRAELKDNIENVSNKIDEMTERNNKRIRAELKDRIGQSYRYYHEKQKINDIEFEALEDLIKSYEEAKGTNSFIHELVQKEMYTWEKVDRV